MRLLALLLTLLCVQQSYATPSPFTVALDIGHSLNAPGARSASGKYEFLFNKQLAQTVAGQLQQQHVVYQLIGEDGQMTKLTDRTRVAASASLFLSLHHDSVQPQYLNDTHRFHGYSIFVSRKNPYPEQSLACARLIAHHYQTAGLAPSLHHAEAIPGENRPFADKPLGIYWFDDLVVLKTAHQPAVLVESGVIVNPQEETWLDSDKGRSTLATALSSAINECKTTLGSANTKQHNTTSVGQ